MEENKDLSYESLKKIIEETLYSESTNDSPFKTMIPEGLPEYMTNEESDALYGSIDDKIHKGFLYQIKTERMTLYAGYSGVKQHIEEYRKWIGDYEIGFMIGITNDEGLYAGTKFIPIHYVTFYEKKETK